MSKAKDKIADMLNILHPDLHFSGDWIKVNGAIRGKYSTEECFFTMAARRPKTFLTYETVYFYSHSPMGDCVKYGIQTKYESYSHYISANATTLTTPPTGDK